MGESIIYMWVEKLREILAEQADELQSSSPKGENVSEESATVDDGSECENNEQYTRYSYEKYEKPPEGLKCPEIFHGEPVSDRRSTFQGHIAKVNDKKEVSV